MLSGTLEQKVTIIPAIKTTNGENIEKYNIREKRVAAYARVSTDEDNQEESYINQVIYFCKYIAQKPGWRLVDVFADEDRSGQKITGRHQFQKMMAMAREGEIDIIILKSLSRFARNMVDFLGCYKELCHLGVEVIFEGENISSFDRPDDFFVNMLAALAQQESCEISQNIKKSIYENHEKGIAYVNNRRLVGYRDGRRGRPLIVKSEANIIREIYQLFLAGHSLGSISEILRMRKRRTSTKSIAWSDVVINNILTNEIYKGDMRFIKTFNPTCYEKRIKNTGERPYHYFNNSHQEIIDKEIFDLVQTMLGIKDRKSVSIKKPFHNKVFFTAEHYNAKCRNNGSKNHSTQVFHCTEKTLPNISKELVIEGFLSTFNQRLKNKAQLIENTKANIKPFPRRNEAVRQAKLKCFLDALRSSSESLHEFNVMIWMNAVDYVEIHREKLIYHYMDGADYIYNI